MTAATTIRPRERDAIMQALRAGVVPRLGQQHIQVGRVAEVKAMLGDIDRVADGGSAIRFVIGEYGSGKTFFLHLVRSIALERKLVTVHADLSPDRRLHATGGQARSLYAELMRNISTRAKPDGGAMGSLVERFVTSTLGQTHADGASPDTVIRARLAQLSELTGGYDFAEVIAAYWRGHDTGNEQLKSDAVRWLRGEFTTKTDARAVLGVRTIVDDAGVYDQLKLLARFVDLLAVLDQNPGTRWDTLVGAVRIQPESNPDLAPLPDEDTAQAPHPATTSARPGGAGGALHPDHAVPAGSQRTAQRAATPGDDDGLATFTL